MEFNCDNGSAKGQDAISIELVNTDLWEKFHKHGTEMIVTKNGRRMFPFVRLKISGLDPTSYYCILLEFTLASRHRFKFYPKLGWTPAGSEETHNNQKFYVHPESPGTGEHWMSQSISFGRVKLTNNTMPPPELMALSSMHKYQPRIIIIKSIDPYALWAPTTTTTFPQTEFLAVTAYQNEEITKLKIEHNPFAKGFRETGLAKCKRKRAESENSDKNEIIKSRSTSSSPSLDQCTSSIQNITYPSYDQYPFLPYLYNPYFYFNHNHNWTHNKVPQSQPEKIPKKLTDFSIRAITGL
ncbi:hypothetical protein FQR65_LT11677 [Abscondita terminalis]|nr:hypothetical protein FQR65_LT11677 [Abscondita terminalis]